MYIYIYIYIYIYRQFCLNSGTVAVSKGTSRRWWCIESLFPACRAAQGGSALSRRPLLQTGSATSKTAGDPLSNSEEGLVQMRPLHAVGIRGVRVPGPRDSGSSRRQEEIHPFNRLGRAPRTFPLLLRELVRAAQVRAYDDRA